MVSPARSLQIDFPQLPPPGERLGDAIDAAQAERGQLLIYVVQGVRIQDAQVTVGTGEILVANI